MLDWVLPGMSGPQVCRDTPALVRYPHLACHIENIPGRSGPGAGRRSGRLHRQALPVTRIICAHASIAAAAGCRKSGPTPKRDRFHAEGILIDFDSRDVWIKGDQVHLTQTEFDILAHLARNRGKVITHDQLISAALSEPTRSSRHDVFVHISRLRKKTERDPPPSPLHPHPLGSRIHLLTRLSTAACHAMYRFRKISARYARISQEILKYFLLH